MQLEHFSGPLDATSIYLPTPEDSINKQSTVMLIVSIYIQSTLINSLPIIRLGAFSGMYIFHTFVCKLDAKKLQMY